VPFRAKNNRLVGIVRFGLMALFLTTIRNAPTFRPAVSMLDAISAVTSLVSSVWDDTPSQQPKTAACIGSRRHRYLGVDGMGDRAAASRALVPQYMLRDQPRCLQRENLLSSGVHMPKTIDEKAVELPPPE